MNPAADSRVIAHGKFFARGGRKFFLKGMRLQDLPADADFAAKLELRRRFGNLVENHTTALILTEAQGDYLDLAGQAGLNVMLELSATGGELLEPGKFAALTSRIAHQAAIRAGSRALTGYLIDCRIGQDELRRDGLRHLQRALKKLIRTIRRRHPNALVGLKHRPDTRALALRDEDFIHGTVPAMEPRELGELVVALHNLAESRPVIVEFTEPSPAQNQAVALAFGMGAAGVVAPALAPMSGSAGLFRMRSAGELLPFVTLNGSCPPSTPDPPPASIVVCAYNAERTMRRCLESLRGLEYPNFEVIVVDDGSRDRTAEIAMEFPEFRLIRQPNRGLSAARNTGMAAARCALIAYTDSDCVVDPHWLTLIVNAMTAHGWDGCGGPNYGPHETGWIEACVAASPGAPSHVLTGEDSAEHLAGCNMVFTRAALEKVGGFDPRFTAAGDDVDIGWRVIDAGMRLGFCPSAFVWHFRRNTIKAYYRQQRGYGRAEAMLYVKYPERFNILGQIMWRGRIPGLARMLPGGGRRRVWWTPPHRSHQTVYEPVHGILSYLPVTLEWNLFWAGAMALSWTAGVTVLPALAMFLLGPLWAIHYALNADLETCHDGLCARLTVAALAYSGPMIRTMTRLRLRLGWDPAARARQTAGAADSTLRQRPAISLRKRALFLSYWNQTSITRDALLERTLKYFAGLRVPVLIDRGWNDYDLEVRPDPFVRVRLKTADEEHEGARLLNRVAARVRPSRLSRYALIAGALASAACAAGGLPMAAATLAIATLGGALCVTSQALSAGRLLWRAVEQSAAELGLIPLGKPISAAGGKDRPQFAPQPAKPAGDRHPAL